MPYTKAGLLLVPVEKFGTSFHPMVLGGCRECTGATPQEAILHLPRAAWGCCCCSFCVLLGCARTPGSPAISKDCLPPAKGLQVLAVGLGPAAAHWSFSQLPA